MSAVCEHGLRWFKPCPWCEPVHVTDPCLPGTGLIYNREVFWRNRPDACPRCHGMTWRTRILGFFGNMWTLYLYATLLGKSGPRYREANAIVCDRCEMVFDWSPPDTSKFDAVRKLSDDALDYWRNPPLPEAKPRGR